MAVGEYGREGSVLVVVDVLFEDAVHVRVVRLEDRVESRIRVVCHVRVDPPVEVIVRLFEEPVEVFTVGVFVITGWRAEGLGVCPWVAWAAV